MQVPHSKKVFFLGDFHLGAPDYDSSLEREKRIVSFLDTIKNEAAVIFIMGDLFDFWFEYKTVVPKGYTRILGKLAELSDSGIEMHFFVGNHDMWMHGYFEKELKMAVHYHPINIEIEGKKFQVGHGDGLGPGDHKYKFLKKIFRNKVAQFCFGALPPSWGMGLANYFSRKSRAATGSSDAEFLGEDKEWLIIHCKETLKKEHFDYFIFGHRHLPLEIPVGNNSIYINTGDWIKYNSYAVFDGEQTTLQYYKDSKDA
ncbi:MAG: UDP-2,3-diacylglucosamine diphosphatase [Chitinophagaceae bacterium]|nr:UDP-2,3-diacylglucosamine diphosphatase [Chitinophagaceae bacterium]